ncbi:MAG TPA: PHP-associated domain-containing protein [Thermoanaerobaculaceae bacterium]|nr:PHP-associated domain-containing protein [Thermoanaerobaculaceae bacterium]
MSGGVRIDLHVHTSRYSPCAEYLEPASLAAAAKERGLGGVVLAEHDILWAAEEVEVLQRLDPSVRLYRGIECTVLGAHLLVIGLDDAARLYRNMQFEEAVRVAREAGAFVVLAHPFRDSDPRTLPVELVDAVEVGSTSFSAIEARRSWHLARLHDKHAVAGSDAHALARVGWAWTELPSLPEDERDLAAMLTAGLGVPRRSGRFPR